MTASLSIEELPANAYRALEQNIQTLRLSILRRAQCLAMSSGASAVSRADIERALEDVVSGRQYAACGDASLDVDVPQDAYFFLEGRLHRLRWTVASLAASEVRGHRFVTPDDIRSVWTTLVDDRAQLQDLLLAIDAMR